MMNKKGFSMGLAVLSLIAIMMVGLMMVNFLVPEVTTFRNTLNCASATTISDGAKLLCLVVDITIPYWIWIILALAVGAVAARVVF